MEKGAGGLFAEFVQNAVVENFIQPHTRFDQMIQFQADGTDQFAFTRFDQDANRAGERQAQVACKLAAFQVVYHNEISMGLKRHSRPCRQRAPVWLRFPRARLLEPALSHTTVSTSQAARSWQAG